MSIVFISYSHTDSAGADAIAAVLDELGIEYFRDVKNIEWGDRISESVREGLQSASAIIIIVSPGSLKSQWVAYEVGFGSATEKRILPYLTHPALDLPGFMSDLSYVKSVAEIREYFAKNSNGHTSPSKGPAIPTSATLTDMLAEYLMEISKPRNQGSIYGGIDEHTGRDAAPYQEAIEVFQKLDLMRYTGSAYKLTPKGWRVVDQLWDLAILDALEVNQYTHETKVAEKVGLADGETELEEVRRHIDALKQIGLVNSTRTSSGVSVALNQQGATHRKHRPIEI